MMRKLKLTFVVVAIAVASAAAGVSMQANADGLSAGADWLLSSDNLFREVP